MQINLHGSTILLPEDMELLNKNLSAMAYRETPEAL